MLDGTEILAVHISRRTQLTVKDTILLLNSSIFAVAATLLSVTTALLPVGGQND